MDRNATLYIAYDSGASPFPSWLIDNYTQTELTIATTNYDLVYSVWKRNVQAGTVTVPGNKNGNPGSVTSNYFILLNNTLPVAVISTSSTEGIAPLTVTFDASGSNDPDGNLTSYLWDFGDGSPTVTSATPSHTYSKAGSFQVSLIVTDNENNESLPAEIIITTTDTSELATITNLSPNYPVTTLAEGDTSTPIVRI